MFGTWETEEIQIEGTICGDTDGCGDDFDLDIVAERVSRSIRVVYEFLRFIIRSVKGVLKSLRDE